MRQKIVRSTNKSSLKVYCPLLTIGNNATFVAPGQDAKRKGEVGADM